MGRLVLVSFILTAVMWQSDGARRNDTIKLPANERYRRLIPYMTFYLHQDGTSTPSNYRQNENLLEQSRYQGYNQGYNHGFVHNNQQNYVPYQIAAPANGYYVQGQSLVKTIAQNYLSPKNRPKPRPQFVPQPQQQPQPPRLPHPPKFLTGFKPMDPNAITITQSQEIQVPQNTQRPYDTTNSPRPFIVHAEHNSLRPHEERQPQRPVAYIAVDNDSQQPYDTEAESVRPYVTPVPEPPRPFIVSIEPNSHPRLPPVEQNSQRPFVQYVTTTIKPQQYYTPVSNHIYPTPSPDYHNEEDEIDGYDISRVLPTKITSDNLESSIKTLSKLLQVLQKANALPQSAKKYTKVKVIQPPAIKYPLKVKPLKQQYSEDVDDEGSTPGKPGVDYPTYTRIPHTRFNCKEQRYKGFFGDPETNCQVWHYCDLNGGQASFLCPNGTIFSQVALTCDWWFNVKCDSTAQLYVLNERLYKYIIPQKPSFPEDYAGPLVDRYLEQKYRELEEQRRKNSTKMASDQDDEIVPAHETNEARRSIEYRT